MSPYLQAFDAYHAAGEPFIPWTDALDFHLQHGATFSSSRLFLMARPVRMDATHQHPTLSAFPKGDAWHVWSAAGNLRDILRLEAVQQLHPSTLITFQRGARGNRIHARELRHLFSRA